MGGTDGCYGGDSVAAIRACRPFFSGLPGERYGAGSRALPRVLENDAFEAWVEPEAGVLP